MDVQLVTALTGNPGASSTKYLPFCCGGSSSGDWTGSGDGRALTEFKAGGVISNISTYVSSNTSSGTNTIRVRKNSANGNCVISFTTATGWLEDTTNTDSVAVGDKLNYTFACGALTALVANNINALWAPTTGTSRPYMSQNSDMNGVTVDQYLPIDGAAFAKNGTTESIHQTNIPTTATLEDMWINVDLNSRAGGVDDVWRSRVNGANGNLAATITRGVTAEFEDITNSDSLVAGDLVNFMLDSGATSGRIVTRGHNVHLTTTDCFVNTGVRQSGSSAVDSYLPFQGYSARTYGALDTEANAQCRADVAFTWSDLWGNLENSSTLSIRSRVNGANGNQIITWSSESGEKIDTTNEDAVAVDDLICYFNDYTSGSPVLRALSSLSTAISGGTDYSLVLDAAGVTVSAQAVTLRTARRLALDAAIATLTAQDVTLRRALRLTLDPVSMTIAAQDITLRNTRRLPLDAAGVTVAAQTVNLNRGQRLVADPASVTLTAQDVTVRTARRLVADAAAVAATAQDVTLSRAGLRLALDPASTAVTAQPVSLQAGRRASLLAGATLTSPQPLALRVGRASGLEPATYSVAAQPLALRAGYRLPVDPAGVVLAVQNVTLDSTSLTHFTLALDPVAMTVQAQPLTLRTARRLGLDAGAFTLAAQPLTFDATRRMTLDPSAVSVAVQQLGIVAQRALALNHLVVSVGTQDITFRRPYRISMDPLSVTLNVRALVFNSSGNIVGVIRLDGSYSPLIRFTGSSASSLSLQGSVSH